MSATTAGWPWRDPATRKRDSDCERNRYQLKRTGAWAPFTDTAAVREHLENLRKAGMTQDQVADAALVSITTVGRAGRAPRMTTAAADAILAVPVPAAAARVQAAEAAVEKLRVLVADGWTRDQLAEATGLSNREVSRILHRQHAPIQRTVEAIDRAHEQLVLEDPGDGHAAARARVRAERAGWHASIPPSAVGDVDEVAVARVVSGDALALRPSERHAAIELLAGRHPDEELARRLGVSSRTVLRHRTQQELPAYAARPPGDDRRAR